MSVESLIEEMARAQTRAPGREKPVAVDALELVRRARISDASISARDIREFGARLGELPIAQREYVLERLRRGLPAVIVKPQRGQEPPRPTAFVPVYFPSEGVAGPQGQPYPGQPYPGQEDAVSHFLRAGRERASRGRGG